MTRDWIWGWAAAFPSIIVAFLAIKSTSLYSENRSLAVGAALALATTIATGVLWIKNKHSLRKIIQSGGGVELVIRPLDAFSRATIIFITIFDTIMLAMLLIEEPVVSGWTLVLSLVTVISVVVLLVKERHCDLKEDQSGGDSKHIMARIGGFWEGFFFLVGITGTSILWDLAVETGVVLEWGLGIIVISLVAYLWSLKETAYTKPG